MKGLLEQFGKQIGVGLVLLAAYWWAFGFGSLLLAAIWFVIGAVAGNYFPALEKRAEALIAKNKT